MISITRNKNNVLICVETEIRDHISKPITLWFTHASASELENALLADRLRAQLEQVVKAMREREYSRGYKDGRAKQGKVDWFWDDLKDRKYS